MFILTSCSDKSNYYKTTNNLIVVISKDITINFNKEKIFVNYYGLKYSDTILFSNIEKSNIKNFYNINDLGSKSGEFWYVDENSVMPAFNDEVIILDNDKIKSRNVMNFGVPFCINCLRPVSSLQPCAPDGRPQEG